MQIEVFSDVVCPWCFVGFARLQEALAARPGIGAQVVWLPFELNPDMPAEGRDRLEYMRERFGDVNRFDAAQKDLQGVGRQMGIDFRFERIRRAPNTRRAHMLLAWARRHGVQTPVKKAVLEAYFTHGLDVGDPEVLAELAADCGLERAAALAALEDSALRSEVDALEALARRWNVSGVPTFVFDRRLAFSGAQPLDVFLQVFDALRRPVGAPAH